MNGPMQIAGSSLETLSMQYRAITHNLANANTVGFKRQVRSQSFSGTMQSIMGGTAESGQVKDQTAIDFSNGRMVHTGRSLDVAIDGKNTFLVVETPDGERYTRNGVLRLNAERQLVTAEGHMVSGKEGPIVLPPTSSATQLNISNDGGVSTEDQTIGSLKLVQFEDVSKLVMVGNGCFQNTGSTDPTEASGARVHQGFQESSNVNIVEELVDLITVTRLYEANLKSMQAQDDRMKNVLGVAAS